MQAVEELVELRHLGARRVIAGTQLGLAESGARVEDHTGKLGRLLPDRLPVFPGVTQPGFEHDGGGTGTGANDLQPVRANVHQLRILSRQQAGQSEETCELQNSNCSIFLRPSQSGITVAATHTNATATVLMIIQGVTTTGCPS